MSDNSAFRIPLEQPSNDTYSKEYMLRLLNQLRINFNTIQTQAETNEPIEAATVTVHITDTSASVTKVFDLVDVAAVTKKGFLVNGENIILDEADILKMTAETANYFDVYVSILEVS